MSEVKLSEFLKTHKQEDACKIIGCTQGAIYQMVKNDRDVRIVSNLDGSKSAYEVKHLSKAS